MIDSRNTPVTLDARIWPLGARGELLNWASWRAHCYAVIGAAREPGQHVTRDEWRKLGFPYAANSKER